MPSLMVVNINMYTTINYTWRMYVPFMKIYRREIGIGEIMNINSLGLIKCIMKAMFKVMDFQGNHNLDLWSKQTFDLLHDINLINRI